MSEKNSFRLSKLVREFNVKIDRILDFLSEKGITGLNPNSKVSHEIYMNLLQEFDASKAAKISAQLLAKENELKKAEEIIRLEKEEQERKKDEEKRASLLKLKLKEKEESVSKDEKNNEETVEKKLDSDINQELIKAKSQKIKGLTTTGKKIDLSKFDKPEAKANIDADNAKKKRKRIVKKRIDPKQFNKFKKQQSKQVEISPEEAQKRVRERHWQSFKELEKNHLLKIEKRKEMHIRQFKIKKFKNKQFKKK